MAKKWYPVIDFDKCSSCGTCIDFCQQGVFDKEKKVPEVIQPDNCIDQCHGCEKKCPDGAISYFGDQIESAGDCGCSCGGCC